MTNNYRDIIPIRRTGRSLRAEFSVPREKSRLKRTKIVLILSACLFIVVMILSLSSIIKKWEEFNYKQGLENLSKGYFDKATDNFEIASNSENEINVLYKLAVSKYNQKDFEGAITAYEKVLEKDPKYSLGYNGLGNLYRDQKNYSQAEDNYKKAIAYDNLYVVAYSNWAIMLIDNGQLEQAKKIVSDGLEKNPQSVELSNLKKILDAN